MDFRILGPLEVLEDGQAVALAGSRQRTLLALLLLHANETLAAERVIDALWGEQAPPTAPSMLHVQVSRLRKALPGGAERLVTRERGYALTVDRGELDADRFEELIATGARELAAGGTRPAANALERALELWRGAPLADLAYAHFAQAHVARLEELRVGAQEQLIEAQLALGRHADVIGPLQALIAEHPYRERLRAQLMVAFYRCDRQAEALDAYQDARRLLVAELGIEPGARLQELERAVLQHDPALTLAEPPQPPQPPQPSPAPAPAPAPVPGPPPAARRVVTVLVAALADAAALAERMDPESLHAVLERFTAACSTVLERHGADADVTAGDTVLGVFGLRMRREDDPMRASRAAVEMREATAALVRDVGFRPTVGIGIAAGEVFASTGARPRGDPMHVAQALATAAGGDEILVDGEAHRLGGASLAVEPAEPVAVRGRRAPVHAFRLRGLAAAQTAPPDGPFVARQEPLAALRATVARAEDEGGCRRVTVVGPPGIGKSRLARELVGGLAGEALVTIARCQAYGHGTAAGPLAELVRGIVGGDPEAWLEAHLGGDERADVIAGRALATLGLAHAAGQPGETAWAVRRVFETAAQERPLLVVLEDAHWADPALLDLVEYVLGFSRAPILILCLARPELLELRPGWAAPQPESTLLALEPLDAAGARTLLAARAPDLDEPVIERMIATAEGNPLFLEQLLEVRGEGDDAVLPPSIEAVLAARIDRLAAEEREVLVHASLEGRSFHAGAVAELLPGTERAMIDGALLRLVHKQLIRPDRPDFPGEDAFRFSHALIRDAAYAGMPKRLRGELHERLAGWLLARPHALDETVGFHLEQAVALRAELGPPDQHDRALAGEAAERLAAAARTALLRGDPGAAGRLLERAVALVPREDPARAELLIELGAALVDAGRLADAERHLAEAVQRAREDGDPRLAARARVELELGRQHAGTGQAAAAAVAESALAELSRYGDEHGRARAWRLQAWIEWASSRARAADVAWRRAAAHARNAGDERELFEILGWRASAAAFGPLPVPEAIDRCEAFRAQAGRRPVAVALILHPLGYLHAMAGDFQRARALVAEGSAIFAELGRMEQAVSHAEATVELLAGRPDVAEALLRPGFASLERMGERAYYGTTAAVLAHAVLAQGRSAEAAGLCAASEANAAPEDVGTQAMWRAVRARLLAADGDLGTAERLAREAAALMEPTDLLNDRADVLLDAAEVLRLAGRTEDARRITAQAIALYEQKGNVVSAGRVRAREPV